MFWIKIYYRIVCVMKSLMYKLVYGARYHVPFNLSFRKGFSLVILEKGRVTIGKNVFFNSYCSVNSMVEVSIGDGTIFGENVKIYDHNHRYHDKNMPIKDQGYSCAPVRIGRHCWIGSNVVILKGVTIGDNCVIGAGCIVYQDIPDGLMVRNLQNQQVSEIEYQI